jgi:DUF4097 and DUF4098 domain-containing protein YvlB
VNTSALRLVALLLVGSVTTFLDAAAPSRVGAQVPVERRRAVTPTASLRMMGGFGELRIIGWEKDSVVVVGKLPQGTRLEGNFGGTADNSPASGMKMFVELPDEAQSAQARLTMYIPQGARLWVKGGSADVTATGVTGSLDINVIGGSVQVTGSPRELTIEAMDASVRVNGSPEWVRAKTATGDIAFVGGSGDATLSTVSGTIHLSGGKVERAKLETITGGVTFAGDLSKQSSLDVNTHSGAIEIAIPRSSSAFLDVASMVGTIDNALTGRPAIAGREHRGQEIGVQVGDGSSRIYVRTFKGNVKLRAR